MRPEDRGVFKEVAVRHRVWILVRRTNPASLRYIGLPGFSPKRIDCKPKTADANVEAYQLAGLVVSPEIHPRAFRGNKQAKAVSIWRSFSHEHGLNDQDERSRRDGAYSVETDENSPHYGCLQFDGNFIHGDYDLYDIISVDHPRGNLAAVETLHGVKHMRGPKFYAIQNDINRRIGVPMIQHGGEAQFTDHSEQSIDMFTPDGGEVTLLNRNTVQSYYTKFWKRRTLRS